MKKFRGRGEEEVVFKYLKGKSEGNIFGGGIRYLRQPTHYCSQFNGDFYLGFLLFNFSMDFVLN
jgi:hypothetical protein